jgi:hypothetical protein
MDELPPWVILQSQNPVLTSVLQELLKNERFMAEITPHFEGGGARQMFLTYIGDPAFLRTLNGTRHNKLRIDRNLAGVSTGNGQADGSVHVGAMIIDVDRIHSAAPDSAAARAAVRDAVLHEFAHLMPMARTRRMTSRLGDPKTGSANPSIHPVIQGENRLRGLVGLHSKDFYGLFKGN